MKHLYVFNLAYDEEDSALAHTVLWVEELSKHYSKMTVLSTHVNLKNFKKKTFTIVELGGGDFKKRLRAMLMLYRTTFEIVRNRNKSVVFYHMSHKPAALVGLFIRLSGVRQTLWYSHQAKPITLYLAKMFVDKILTPVESSFPFQTSKLKIVGHGVYHSDLLCPTKTILINERESDKILVVGRVSKVKRIETLVDALSGRNYGIHLIGRKDGDYWLSLNSYARQRGVMLDYLGEFSRDSLCDIYRKYSVGFSGTRGSIDKAPLEMAQHGIFVLSENIQLLEIIGQISNFVESNHNHLTNNSLVNQLENWDSMSLVEKIKFSNQLAQFNDKKNTLESVINRISIEINSIL